MVECEVGPINEDTDQFKRGDDDKLLVCPFVKCKSGKVRRVLTEGKLMDIYDVEVSLRMLPPFQCNDNTRTTHAYAKQVPAQVLYHVVNQVMSLNTTENAKAKRSRDNSRVEIKTVKKLKTEGNSKENQKATDRDAKATKADDAEVDVRLWNFRTMHGAGIEYDGDRHDRLLDVMRRKLLGKHRKDLRKKFTACMVSNHGSRWLDKVLEAQWRCKDNLKPYHGPKLSPSVVNSRKRKKSAIQSSQEEKAKELLSDFTVGQDALIRATNASFWEWSDGSTLFFWRWQKEYRKEVRDGLNAFINGELPNYWRAVNWPEDAMQREQLKKKISKVMRKGYISPGEVKSLIAFFAVPKGPDDIRIVYDATKCGLNEVLWSPKFWLPIIHTILRSATPNTYYGVIDLGEMFLN